MTSTMTPQRPRKRFTMSAAGTAEARRPQSPGELSFDEILEASVAESQADGVKSAAAKRRRRTIRRRILVGAGIVSMTCGVALGIAQLAFPDVIAGLYGDAKTGVEQAIGNAREQAHRADIEKIDQAIEEAKENPEADAVPEIPQETREAAYGTLYLGERGDKATLDRCDGTFTLMASYEQPGVLPTGAAHNSCGGDVMLPWEVGQRTNLSGLGYDGLYEVVDIRYTSKIWNSTDDIVGMDGDVSLQTCFYGEDRMKFLGFERIG